MIDLGYSAVVFPQFLFLFSTDTDEVLTISKSEDGDAHFDTIVGMIEKETPYVEISAFAVKNLVITDV